MTSTGKPAPAAINLKHKYNFEFGVWNLRMFILSLYSLRVTDFDKDFEPGGFKLNKIVVNFTNRG